MFEAVVTPDCTKEKICLTMGIPKREGKAKDIKKYEQTTIRDLGECYKDYYEEMTAFSVLSLIEKEKSRRNGEQYDPITQQYYLRACYYNPLVGRFTQEDVYGEENVRRIKHLWKRERNVCMIFHSTKMEILFL